jgi:hypothetical protein
MLGSQKQSACVGWHLPIALAEDVRQLAADRGIRPGYLVTEILTQQIAIMRAPISASQLEQQVRYPEHFSRR